MELQLVINKDSQVFVLGHKLDPLTIRVIMRESTEGSRETWIGGS